MSARYKPINSIRNDELDNFLPADEQRFWMQMKETAVFEESTSVTNCDFRPAKPFNLASTSGSKLTVFDTELCQPVSIYTRFKAPILYVKYRSDGNLLGVLTQNGRLQFFDVHTETELHHNKQGSHKPIRTFKTGNSQIGAFDYDQAGKIVASFNDNGYIKLYDLSIDNSEPLWSCIAHTDAIRTGAFSQSFDHYLATGSYDHTIRYWDVRQKNGTYLHEFNHGFPVEKILFLEEENMIVSAGGPFVKIWDLSSGELFKTLKFHNKTITSMCLASDRKCIITGGIDRRINIVQFDNSEFDRIHSFKVESPVLSLSIDLEDKCMAIGMGNKLAIYRQNEQQKMEKKLKKKEKRRSNKNYFKEALNFNESGEISNLMVTVVTEKERDGIIENINLESSERQIEHMTLGKNDYLLREGSYRELISKILLNGKISSEYIVAVFQQIRIRQALEQALSNQGKRELQQLFGFLSTHLFEIPFFDILYDVAIMAIETYTRKSIPREVKKMVKWWEKKVATEMALQKELCQTIGIIQMVTSWNRMNFYNNSEESMEIDLNGQEQFHQSEHFYEIDHEQTNSETSSIT